MKLLKLIAKVVKIGKKAAPVAVVVADDLIPAIKKATKKRP